MLGKNTAFNNFLMVVKTPIKVKGLVICGACEFDSTQTRGMLLLTKAKRPLKFKMLCGFNKHAVKLRMHKAALYAFPIPLNTF